MTDEERRAAGQILVAFRDAATWFEEMAQTVQGNLRTLQQGGRPGDVEIRDTITRIDNVLRQLESHTRQVDRMRVLLGL